MTDEERKELEATANWVMIPNEEVSNAVVNGLRWGVAPTVARLISNKNEREIYNLLDYWYKFNNNLSREQFVENVIHLIQHDKLDITSQQIEWINRWEREEGNYNTDSPIVKEALKNKRLRLLFQSDIGLLKEFIEELEKAAKVSKKAEVIVNYLSKEQYDIKNKKKELCELLNDIGFSLNYNTFKGAIWNAATEKGDKERESRRAAKQ